MRARWYAHLPGLRLDGAGDQPVGRGRLTYLPFEDWQRLDDSFPYNDSQYHRSRPLFYTGELELPPGFTASTAELQRVILDGLVEPLYRACLLAPHAPLLAPPHLSVTYVVLDDSSTADGGIRHSVALIGAVEREWVVFGSDVQTTFTADDVNAVQAAFALLAEAGAVGFWPGVIDAIETLALTSMPEVCLSDRDERLDLVNSFVHCVAAAERILLPRFSAARKGLPIAKTFARHAAALVSTPDDLAGVGQLASSVYALRSDLIHGRYGPADLSEEQRRLLVYGRILLRNVILSAQHVRRRWHLEGDDALPALLARAYEDAWFRQQLRRPRLVFARTEAGDDSR